MVERFDSLNRLAEPRSARLIHYLQRLYRRLPLKAKTRAMIRSRARLMRRLMIPWWRPGQAQCMASTPPVAALPGHPDRIFFAVIDWHFRMQRPQHLALQSAALGYRAFYVSNEFLDDVTPGFCVERLDTSGRLFQIRLKVRGADAIYFGCPSAPAREQLRQGLEQLRDWADMAAAVSIIQHPFWTDIVRYGGNEPVVYDCMDYHEGFETFADELRWAERRLMQKADLTIVTSSWLETFVSQHARQVALIRNGVDDGQFAMPPREHFMDAQGRRVIGYYGALGAWFDADLVRAVAHRFSDCLVILVGGDQAQIGRALRGCQNVKLTGEVPYTDLPYYLYGFDVCLLPFRMMPLTLATNPVKMYEYLASGKPVVSVDLPEARACAEQLGVAADTQAFCDLIAKALASGTEGAAARRKFASQQTWANRALAFNQAIDRLGAIA
ncbi:MAG: glycosyltransferase [Lamprobacter sp.]|uniref:glycosyltransferase n=1 Tax=Lamprobacter sp. TaxID=3100796 RepID=UPI002B26016E|nr:glycosyltransferase [Lamprobacter sp.]MEA3638327.1 glycosyltransferase [Lamprobacter sp.]